VKSRLRDVRIEIRFDDLVLECEDLGIRGIDGRTNPLGVVARTLGVGAGRLHPGEVLDPVAVPVEERLVDPEVVRIAVDEDNGATELDRLAPELREEVVETVLRQFLMSPSWTLNARCWRFMSEIRFGTPVAAWASEYGRSPQRPMA
jgi:hypothetical protein